MVGERCVSVLNGELNCGYEVWAYIKRCARDHALSDARIYEMSYYLIGT